MERLKILHIIKSLGRGGAETLLPETLKVHDQQHFEFHYIYFLPWKNQMVDEIKVAGGKVFCISANNNIQLMFKARAVARYVRENNIRLIHAHLPWAGVLARVVGKIAGVRVIYTEHNKQERYHWATRLMNLATMNWLAQVVAVSHDVEESIRKYKRTLRTHLMTIQNGVNVERFVPAQTDLDLKQKLNIPAEGFVIGTIAVFRFQKRLDLWLEIAAKVLRQRQHVYFVIVGDGPLKAMLLEKLEQLGIRENVRFAGLQTDVRPYLTVFDVYMMCSVFEGLPIALLEAMSSGIPVITTDAGGIREVIRPNVDGLSCDVNRPEELVDFAVTLIDRPQRRAELATAARKRIVSDFSMKAMVTSLEEVYSRLTSI